MNDLLTLIDNLKLQGIEIGASVLGGLALWWFISNISSENGRNPAKIAGSLAVIFFAGLAWKIAPIIFDLGGSTGGGALGGGN